jgi:hypothetical protein
MAIGGTVTGGTPKSVLFVGALGVLAQDNAEFQWDYVGKTLGIGGAASATFKLAVQNSGAFLGGIYGNAMGPNQAAYFETLAGSTATEAVNIIQSSVSVGNRALYVENTSVTIGTIMGIRVKVGGANTTNIAGYFDATGAVTNYAIQTLGDIVPAATTLYNLGVTSLRWNDLWVTTVKSGVWNGTLIATGFGGTGTSTTFTLGSVVFAGALGVYTEDNSNFFWDNVTKNLGIGTKLPVTKLHIEGPFLPGILIGAPGGGLPILVGRSYGGTEAAPTATVIASTLFSLVGQGYGTSYVNGASIAAVASETFTAIANGSRLIFSTTPIGSAALAERMRLSDAGKLGIGVTAPTAFLHLKAGTAAVGTAPFKMNSGTLLATPEAGAMEFLTDDYFVTITTGTARQALARCLTGSAALDFPNTLAQTSSDLTIAVTGAAVGDVVSLGIPSAAVNANSEYTARVSAANTVTVRFNNYSIAAINPASGTFKVIVFKN